eukprot:GHVQ01030470.1.p1 GENE.GHVQ01030470.1~~GHVQ01030470.1.p1  ORF type:complete len:376 (+),score=62.96 GHVQ01030470.1:255-1382(+)
MQTDTMSSSSTRGRLGGRSLVWFSLLAAAAVCLVSAGQVKDEDTDEWVEQEEDESYPAVAKWGNFKLSEVVVILGKLKFQGQIVAISEEYLEWKGQMQNELAKVPYNEKTDKEKWDDEERLDEMNENNYKQLLQIWTALARPSALRSSEQNTRLKNFNSLVDAERAKRDAPDIAKSSYVLFDREQSNDVEAAEVAEYEARVLEAIVLASSVAEGKICELHDEIALVEHPLFSVGSKLCCAYCYVTLYKYIYIYIYVSYTCISLCVKEMCVCVFTSIIFTGDDAQLLLLLDSYEKEMVRVGARLRKFKGKPTLHAVCATVEFAAQHIEDCDEGPCPPPEDHDEGGEVETASGNLRGSSSTDSPTSSSTSDSEEEDS